MRIRFLAIALLLLPLTGCFSDGEKFGPMPSDIAPLFGGGGGGGAVAPAPAPAPAQVPGTAAAKVLQDPEAREEADSEYVWADDDAQAAEMCRQVAATYGGRMDSVTPSHVKEWRNNWGKRKYTCFFTRFVEPSYDDSRRY